MVEFLEDHTFTRDEAAQIAKKNKFPKLNLKQSRSAKEAQHRVLATREKLGLPRINAADGPNVMNNYEGAGGALSFMLGVAQGLMYHEGTRNSCYNSIEGSLLSFDNLPTVIVHVYMPWYWSDLQVIIMDSITMSSNFYSECDVDKLMTTCTKIITVEGVSELASRAVGAIFFEYKDLMQAFKKDKETGKFIYSSNEIGKFIGRAVSVTLAWTI